MGTVRVASLVDAGGGAVHWEMPQFALKSSLLWDG